MSVPSLGELHIDNGKIRSEVTQHHPSDNVLLFMIFAALDVLVV